MMVALTTAGYGLATGLASASVLAGTASEMDGYRKFFLTEKSSVDDILKNSREFEEKYSINDTFDLPVGGGSDDSGKKESPASALGAVGGVSAVATEVVKSYFNYKYLLWALGLGFVYKVFFEKKYSRKVIK